MRCSACGVRALSSALQYGSQGAEACSGSSEWAVYELNTATAFGVAAAACC
jgi:hypothetical protein